MAHIDDLQFNIVLDVDKFNKDAKTIEDRAKQLSAALDKAFNLKSRSNLMTKEATEALKRQNSVIEDGNRKRAKTLEMQKREEAKTATIIAREEEKTRKITAQGAAHARNNTHLTRQAALLSQLKGLATTYVSVLGGVRLISSLIRITGEFEAQHVALRAILQDTAGADQIFSQLQELAVKSPFTFRNLTSYAKQLSAFSVPMEEIYDTTKRLADVSAGLGVDMSRIILAYGQVRSAAYLRGQELRQFTEAGIPLLQILAKQFEEIEGHAITTGEVFDRISKRQVPFAMIEKAFRDMTSEGGKFYNMQEILAETVKGKVSNLQDAWEIMLSRIGNANSGLIKGSIDGLRFLLDSYEELGRILLSVAVAYGTYTAAAALGSVATGAATVKSLGLVAALRNVLAALLKLIHGHPVAAVIGVVAGGVVMLIQHLRSLTKEQRELNARLDEGIGKGDALKYSLKYYIGELERATVGTEQYDKAKQQLYDHADNFLTAMDKEAIEVGNLAGLYDRLAASIDIATNRQITQAEVAQAASTRRQKLDDVFREFERLSNKHGWAQKTYQGESLKEVIASYLRGEMDYQSFANGPGMLIGRYFQNIARLADRATAANNAFDQSILTIKNRIEAEFGPNSFEMPGPMSPVDLTLPEDKLPQDTSYEKAMAAKIKANIDNLKLLKDFFNQAKELGMSDEGAMAFLAGFGYVVPKEGFESAISSQIEAMRQLGGEYVKQAQELEEGITQDKVKEKLKELQDAAKAAEEVNNILEKLKDLNAPTEGAGVEYKIRKVLSDAKKQKADIDDIVTTGVREATAAYKENNEELERQIKLLNEYAIAAKAAVDAEAREKITGMASSIYAGLTRGLDLSDWSHKSGREIREIITALDNIDLPPEIAALIEDPDTGEQLLKALVDLALADQKKARGKGWEKLASDLKEGASAIQEGLGAIEEYAEASGNDDLLAFAKALGSELSTLGSIAEKLARGDIVSAAAEAVGTIIKNIAEVFIAEAKLQKAIKETQLAARAAGFEDNLTKGMSTIFGTDEWKGVQNAMENIAKLQAEINEGASSFGVKKTPSAKWWEFFSVFTAGAAVIKTIKSASEGTMRLSDLAEELGYDMYDAYGNLNVELLEAIKNTYKLTSSQEEWIDKAIVDSKAYTQAMQQVESTMQDIFGEIADSAADAIIDSWVEAGNAALDYADILDDVARSYSKMVIKSMILDTLQKDGTIEATVKAFTSGDYDKAMAIIEGKMQEVAALEPVLTNVLSAFDKYYVREEDQSGGTSESLGTAIKTSITEDTASLLASYINAIRADVSTGKTYWERIAKAVEGWGAGLPNLQDYIVNIEAQTANIAESNSDILYELRRVITTEGGAPAVRSIAS